jgi:hypothetical protein
MEMVVILQTGLQCSIAVVPAVRGQKWPRVGGIALAGIAALVIGILGRPRDSVRVPGRDVERIRR